ncbi:hypothetical protein ACFX13_029517 [Malus domestica]
MACPLINLLFFVLFMFLPFSTLAQTAKNISLGSSLTALNENSSSWTSPSGDFAIGFQRIGKEGFLLAIWFDKIKDKTIVWSANGENLVPEGSKVELSNGGEFMLNDAVGFCGSILLGPLVFLSQAQIGLAFCYPFESHMTARVLIKKAPALYKAIHAFWSEDKLQKSSRKVAEKKCSRKQEKKRKGSNDVIC